MLRRQVERHSHKQNQELSYCQAAIQEHLLSVLISEFGGEARCIDLNTALRSLFRLECSEEASLRSARGVIRNLEAQGRVALEHLDRDVLVARITVEGVVATLDSSVRERPGS